MVTGSGVDSTPMATGLVDLTQPARAPADHPLATAWQLRLAAGEWPFLVPRLLVDVPCFPAPPQVRNAVGGWRWRAAPGIEAAVGAAKIAPGVERPLHGSDLLVLLPILAVATAEWSSTLELPALALGHETARATSPQRLLVQVEQAARALAACAVEYGSAQATFLTEALVMGRHRRGRTLLLGLGDWHRAARAGTLGDDHPWAPVLCDYRRLRPVLAAVDQRSPGLAVPVYLFLAGRTDPENGLFRVPWQEFARRFECRREAGGVFVPRPKPTADGLGVRAITWLVERGAVVLRSAPRPGADLVGTLGGVGQAAGPARAAALTVPAALRRRANERGWTDAAIADCTRRVAWYAVHRVDTWDPGLAARRLAALLEQCAGPDQARGEPEYVETVGDIAWTWWSGLPSSLEK